jgi:hypothetical protein
LVGMVAAEELAAERVAVELTVEKGFGTCTRISKY